MFDMKKPSRREFLTLAGSAAGASLLGSTGLVVPRAYGAGAFAPVKEQDAVIAFGHVGPISDEGWTSQHHEGLPAVKKAYPKAKYIEVETIPYSADATRSFRQFVSEFEAFYFVFFARVLAAFLAAASRRSAVSSPLLMTPRTAMRLRTLLPSSA